MMLPINNVDYNYDYSNLDYNNNNNNHQENSYNNNNNDHFETNSDRNSVSNWVEKLSLSDISVGEILDIYKNDTDLLKHILAAKTEEDKRKGAEELRRAEEARLHSKFIDLQLDQNRRSSCTNILDDNNSLGLSTNDWLPSSNNTTRGQQQQQNSNDLLSPFLNNTPPSPSSQLHQPLSPYTLFDVPSFADLNLSAPSSPEAQNPPPLLPILVEKIKLVVDDSSSNTTATTTVVTNTNNGGQEQQNNNNTTTLTVNNNEPPPVEKQQRASCKRTLSRTRSTRKPSIKALSKKNRSSIQQPSTPSSSIVINTTEQQQQQQQQQQQEVPPLDHDKVMEALRAKLQRSTQQQKELKDNPRQEITSMSPSGILLLDLKNPKKSFPVRPKATPRASVVKKPNSFISAHKPKE